MGLRASVCANGVRPCGCPRGHKSHASRCRLARWLVGSPIKDIERDLVLETLAKTDGNRTASARLLGFSIRTLRDKNFRCPGASKPITIIVDLRSEHNL